MRIKPRCITIIVAVLTLAPALLLSSPHPTLALSFTITSQHYSVYYDIDRPGYPPSPASQNGSRSDFVSGNYYYLNAVSAVSGQISCSPFTMGKGAGGYHWELWDVSLALVGDYGEAADIYIDSEVSGSLDVWVGGAAGAYIMNESMLAIYNAGYTELLQYHYLWTDRWDGAAVIIDREFEDIIDSRYLGTMIVGDPVWGSIRILGNHYATAYAQAHAFVAGLAITDIVSGFEFRIDALPHSDPTPEPIPEPATMFLLGAGLIGIAGLRRKFRK